MTGVCSCVPFFTVLVLVFISLHYLSLVTELALCFIAIWVTDSIMPWIHHPFSRRRLLSRLKDKAVLVTGCDTGFGHELARRLDNIGVTVFAGCLFPDGAGAKELETLCSGNLHILRLDVTNEDDVVGAVKEVSASLGDKKLWAVVNNAGVVTFGETELCTLDNFKRVLDVNVLGTTRVTKAFLPMVRRAHGRVVIVASIAGRYTLNGLVAYSMSKHATVALADGLRREMMKFGVTVHCVEPWMYRTNINNLDYITNILKQNWSQTPKEVTDDYGERFLKETLDHYSAGQKHMSPDTKIHEVVNDMIHAAVGETPKIRYEEGTLWIMKLLMYLPPKWLDYFTNWHSPSNVVRNAQLQNGCPAVN